MRIKHLFKRLDHLLLGIILLASFLRFYNYSSRWALAYDQAWFAIIARHAVNSFQLPFLGPFASGGPFQTGGEWFWIVMIGTLFGRWFVIAPWVFVTLLSILQVYLMYLLGREMINKKFGLIVALLTALSTSQALQSTNLTNQTLISLFSILLLWSCVKYFKTKQLKYTFLVGLSVGLASSIHLQGVMLLPVVVVFIIIGKIIHPKKIFLIGLGILIPWLPVLFMDAQNNFLNTKNMLGFFASDRNKASYDVLGRRWLTYLSKYIPSSWGRIIGGPIIVGYIEIVLVAIVALIEIIKRRLTKEWYLIGISVVVIFGALRYLRTPLFENYITFIHPFVFLLTGWVILKLLKINKIAAIILLFAVCALSFKETITEMKGSTNATDIQAKQFSKFLELKYPNEKFSVYDYDHRTTNRSLPMVLYLQTHGRMSDNGRKIGYGLKIPKNAYLLQPYPVIYGEQWSDQLFDLSASKSGDLIKAKWEDVNPAALYNSVQYWFRYKKIL